MTEYVVELQDTNGTAYGTTYPFSNDTLYFEDLEEARLYAKGRVNDEYVIARVVDTRNDRIVDFFNK